ncbi:MULTISPECIES: class I SAM-dependent RNA methyltransferase [unclassified Streptococcus]|uniref:THUMP domain-containing class I SAM-dependent RNA methyltransferase n=1 Tax=unclassified Streptococcus TaxID=2608887 RepID=UPI0010721D50|nr:MULTISPECIES: class I SAM-dependent RNA methyltransferase [unclassified Streptococcus]MBF0805528.1 class I SAM-dependent RNA methyltransferase [Streptococcus sp. 19428wA2_WM07]TFU28981.1 class I SAM-dependent RNA methyltransferase [Streptococcus sp. WM07]
MKKEFQMVATAAAGLEALVGRELRDLGMECQVENGKVHFQGKQEELMKANLWLRTADRVKLVLGQFPAKTFEELYQGVFAIDWQDYLPLGVQFPVSKARCVRSKLHNEPSVQAITKKAVVRKMQKVYARPDGVPLPESGPVFSIEVSIRKDQVTIMLDTSGDSLFKRGYRTDKGGAPLKENMAAALVNLSNWFPDKPLLDPTCGSGTIVIEAAMKALNIAPGLRRSFAFESWPWIDQELWRQLKETALAAQQDDVELSIMASDIDGRMVELARENAKRAGVLSYITFKQMRLQDFQTNLINGVVISNPPYGERLMDDEGVSRLYQEMGETFAPLRTWSKFILTSDGQFEEKYGSLADKKRKLYNGTLRVDYYQYYGERVRRSDSGSQA